MTSRSPPGIFPLAGQVGLQQAAVVSPARWGFGAAASTVNLNVIQQPVVTAAGRSAGPSSLPTDPVWNHTAATWLRDMALMLALGLLFSLLTWWRLVRIQPGRRG